MDHGNDIDRQHMAEALQLAFGGMGRTSPNPMVGSVVVRDGVVVGRGCHEQVGGPHAEVNALEDAGEAARGATLYVTLEPCNHFGRTPPCTQAILERGVRRVVIGMMDPNPRVEGGGAAFLEQKGIAVSRNVLEEECRQINQPFIKHSTTGIPHVTLKAAATLDGRIATHSGDSRWITSEESREFVHRMRAALDAILVGIGTALHDDPQLTARLPATPHVRQPVRIVVDTHLKLPLHSQLVQTARETPLWVACGPNVSEDREESLLEAGVKTLRLPLRSGRPDLEALLLELGKRQVSSVLVEGGAHILGAFIEDGLGDDFHFFYAPKILADPRAVPMVIGQPRDKMSEAIPVYDTKVRCFGDDVMISGRFRERLY